VAIEAERTPGLTQSISRIVFGDGTALASTVYGTIVVMATLTVGYASETHPWTLAVLVSTTAFILWVAHLYAHGLSESIALHRRLTRREFFGIARRELGLVLAAAMPTGWLLLGAFGVLHERLAVWLALGSGLLTLAAGGLRYARLEGFSGAATLAAVAANLALGMLVVFLKVAIAH
jgi:hypothetical protein